MLKKIKEITGNNNVKTNRAFDVYDTLDIYSFEELPSTQNLTLHGYKIKPSQRYTLFSRDDKVCVKCGLEASFWALQRNDKNCDRPHLNLYGINEYDEIVLFTKDHIIPKSLGGGNTFPNYQIMCSTCNSKKANKVSMSTGKYIKVENLDCLDINTMRQLVLDCKKVKNDIADILMGNAKTIKQKFAMWIEFKNDKKDLELGDLNEEFRSFMEDYVEPEKYNVFSSIQLKNALDGSLEDDDITEERYFECLKYMIDTNMGTLEWNW